MERRAINAPDAPTASGGYSQAVEIAGAKRLLFISGQIPVDAAGALPPTFREQCLLAWANVEAQLRAAGLDLSHLVKVTTFLADRSHAMENREVRNEVLGDLKPALTVIIAGIFDRSWLIEIEAIAAE
ncbi:MAG: RidA family protein [Hyphomonadaceae bacterium]|nr:RidA family protein [Hyphomonadaceae bacterium]